MSDSELSRARKAEGGLAGRLKTLFRPPTEQSAADTDSSVGVQPSAVSRSVWNSLSPLTNDFEARIAALASLSSTIRCLSLDCAVCDELWSVCRDLLIVDGQFRATGVDFFVELSIHHPNELSLELRLDALACADAVKPLTNDSNSEWLRLLSAVVCNGPMLAGIEFETAALVLGRFDSAIDAITLSNGFLKLVHEVVLRCRHCIDSGQLDQILGQVCSSIMSESTTEVVAKHCLEIVDAILSNGVICSDSIALIARALCVSVSNDRLCQQSWQLMRNLLSGPYGYDAVHVMCCFLQQPRLREPLCGLRGAVFCLSMCFWGTQRVASLRHTPTAILPAFSSILMSSGSVEICFEVALSIQRLTSKYGRDLQFVTWDLILTILQQLLDIISQQSSDQTEEMVKVASIVHGILTAIEWYHENGSYGGSSERLFGLVELHSQQRPENSILKFLSHKSQTINPLKNGWLDLLSDLLLRFYRNEQRPGIRIKALFVLRNVFQNNQHLFGVRMIEELVLPFLGSVTSESDDEVRTASISFLCDVHIALLSQQVDITCSGDAAATALSLLSLLEQVLAEPQIVHCSSVLSTIDHFISVLATKFATLSAATVASIVDCLCGHIEMHYSCSSAAVLESNRLSILQCLAGLRCNSTDYRLGISTDEPQSEIIYNSKLLCVPAMPDLPNGVTRYRWASLADMIVAVLKHESSWPNIVFVINWIPQLLNNRSFVASDESVVEPLCQLLLSLTRDRRIGVDSQQLSLTEIGELLCPALGALAVYKDCLSDATQSRLVMVVQECLVSDGSSCAVIATISCLLELTDIAVTMAKDLVTRLADLKPSARLAIAILELTSTMVHIQQIHSRFDEKHYQRVFDSLLPYTNVYAYTSFIVAKAYMVMFRWFCQSPYQMRISLARNLLVGNCKVRRSRSENDQDASLRHFEEETMALLSEFLRQFTCGNDACDLDKSSAILPSNNAKQAQSFHWVVGQSIISVRFLNEGIRDIKTAEAARVTLQVAEEPPPMRRRHQSAIQPRQLQAADSPAKALDDLALQSLSSLPIASHSTSNRLPSFTVVDVRHTFGSCRWTLRNDTAGKLASNEHALADLALKTALHLCQLANVDASLVVPVGVSHLAAFDRSLRMLDLIGPRETHTIGVVYAARRQRTEAELLSNSFGSERYDRFLSGLGELVPLQGGGGRFLGGLRSGGADGKYTHVWSDAITEVVFHVATLMPPVEGDAACGAKKRLIGNDLVTIVFNESGRDYRLGTISGKLAHVAVVVQPQTAATVSVAVHAKDEITRWLALKRLVVSNEAAPAVCRQLAMRAELSARVWCAHEATPDQPYAGRALERLRQLKEIAQRAKKQSFVKLDFSTDTIFDSLIRFQ